MNIIFNENINEQLLNGILYEGKYKIVLINGQKLVVFINGTIYRVTKTGNLKLVKNTANSDGYNLIGCNGKLIRRHRILGYAFLNLNIDDVKQQIDHIDGKRINNQLNNLRVVNNQENQFNRNALGYYFNKRLGKYQAQIQLDTNKIYLGLYTTEQDAREAYLKAKLIYHII